jgi:hypothetical protein
MNYCYKIEDLFDAWRLGDTIPPAVENSCNCTVRKKKTLALTSHIMVPAKEEAESEAEREWKNFGDEKS